MAKPLASWAAIGSAIAGKRNRTERCTASTVFPPTAGLSQMRPSMVAVSLSVISTVSTPRSCAASLDDVPKAAPVMTRLRREIPPSPLIALRLAKTLVAETLVAAWGPPTIGHQRRRRRGLVGVYLPAGPWRKSLEKLLVGISHNIAQICQGV